MKSSQYTHKLIGRYGFKLLTINVFILLCCLLPLHAQTINSTMDWETGTMTVQVSSEPTNQPRNRAAALFTAEQSISRQIQAIIFDELLKIQVDSSYTLLDLVRQDHNLFRKIEEISSQAQQWAAVPSMELNSLITEYKLSLFPAVSGALVRHSSSFPMDDVLGWQPGSDYTGLVIYAARELPVHGLEQECHMQPSLFPVLYDENMRVLLDRNRMDPEYASMWGGAAFTTGYDETDFVDRIGENPLRIVATSVFGIIPGDPIIPVDSAQVLLHSEQGRRLLREGRILIIYTDM